MFANEALDYLDCDYGVVGDGETSFNRLLETLAAGGVVRETPGLVWRENGQVRISPPAWSHDLERLPLPDRRGVDLARYYGSKGTAGIPNSATVQTKRGCPLSCIYCSTATLEGVSLRVRSPAAVMDELEELVESGFQRIQFVDSLFTNPPSHAHALCEAIIRRGLAIQWSCTINPGFASPSLLQSMKQAGCQLVMVGNESGCTQMLTRLNKGFDQKQVAACFTACEALGLRYHAFLLLGGPTEDRTTVQESVAFLQRFSPAQVSVTVGIRLYPGCELTRLAQAQGLLRPDASLLFPTFCLAPAVRDWIFDYLEPVMEQNKNWTY